jgi:hypothetical protein
VWKLHLRADHDQKRVQVEERSGKVVEQSGLGQSGEKDFRISII